MADRVYVDCIRCRATASSPSTTTVWTAPVNYCIPLRPMVTSRYAYFPSWQLPVMTSLLPATPVDFLFPLWLFIICGNQTSHALGTFSIVMKQQFRHMLKFARPTYNGLITTERPTVPTTTVSDDEDVEIREDSGTISTLDMAVTSERPDSNALTTRVEREDITHRDAVTTAYDETSPGSTTQTVGGPHAQSTSPSRDVTPAQSTSPGGDVTPEQSTSPSSDVTPAQSTSASGDVTPAQSTSASGDVTPVQSTSASGDVTPAQSTSPGGDVTPVQSTSASGHVTPAQSTSPSGDVTPVQNTSASGDVTPAQSTSPGGDVTPAEKRGEISQHASSGSLVKANHGTGKEDDNTTMATVLSSQQAGSRDGRSSGEYRRATQHSGLDHPNTFRSPVWSQKRNNSRNTSISGRQYNIECKYPTARLAPR